MTDMNPTDGPSQSAVRDRHTPGMTAEQAHPLTCHLCVFDEEHDLCCFIPMCPVEVKEEMDRQDEERWARRPANPPGSPND